VGEVVLNPPVDGNSMSVQNDIQCESLGARSALFSRGTLTVQGDSQVNTLTVSSTLKALIVSTPTIVANAIGTSSITASTITTSTISGLLMNPSPPISGTYGTQWGTFVIAGLRLIWGITNGNQSAPYYSSATFLPSFGAIPLVFLTSLTYANVPSWWSIVDVQVNGFTSLGLNEPGRPLAAACQYLAIGPA
jgi:hypothetical protein